MNRFVASFAFGVLSVSSAFAATDPGKAPAGQPTTAAAAAAAAAATPTMFDEAYFLKAAQAAADSGDRDGAVQLWQSAIVYAPSDPLPYQQIASFYAKSKQSELAQRYYSLALEVQPTYAPALRGLAMLDLAAGNRQGAMTEREILVRACANCPETAEVEKALSGQTPVLDRSGTAQ